MAGTFPRNQKASEAEIALARQRRLEGDTLPQIAKELGRSIDWAWKVTMDLKKGKIRVRTNTIYKNFPHFPKDPVLKQRILNLAKRGYDVPPSKQADWDTLAKSGYPAEERRRILKLE